jgi:TPR repeat protein
LFEHDLFRKQVPTFRDHALGIHAKASIVSNKLRVKFKVSVIDNACLVARAVRLMTNNEFSDGYNLIKDLPGSEFLIALRMLAERHAIINKLCDFRARQKAKDVDSIETLLTRAAERGDEEAKSLLAAGALEQRL